MGQQRHKARSPLSGPHPLQSRKSQRSSGAGGPQKGALEILRDVFAPQQRVLQKLHLDGAPASSSSAAAVDRAVAEASQAGTLIVPRKGQHHLPYHVMSQPSAHPWELLPMRAAALKEYPGLFAEACLFFSSLQDAVHRNQPQRLLRCTKASLDLAKLLRNLGVLAGFEVVQNLARCKPHDVAWPAGAEPQSYGDLALYPNLYVKLNLRWDAYKPLWRPPSLSVLQEQLHPTDALPFAVRHLSKPSVPTLMSPQDFRQASTKLPAGIGIMYHHQLGLTVDAVVEQHDVPALALTHLALPWVQVAQIKAAVRDKVQEERRQGLALRDTARLTEWRVSEWVRGALAQRQAQVAELAHETRRHEEAIGNQVAALTQQDTEKARQALMAGQTLRNELLSVQLLGKLQQASAALQRSLSAPSGPEPAPASSSSPPPASTPAPSPSSSSASAGPASASAAGEGPAGRRLFGGARQQQQQQRGSTLTSYGSTLPPVGPSQGRHQRPGSGSGGVPGTQQQQPPGGSGRGARAGSGATGGVVGKPRQDQ